MSDVSISAVELAALMGTVARELLGEPNAELSNSRESRYGRHGSLVINLEEGTWYDHENEQGGGVLDLVARQTNLSKRSDQFNWLASQGFTNCRNSNTDIAAAHDYRDENGNLLFQVVRQQSKQFRQRRPDGQGGWINNVKGIRQVPYKLPTILAHPEAQVFVVEGEKDADRLNALGLCATCNAGGAGKWTDTHSQYLSGRSVVVLPDNDAPGHDHARKARASLEAAGARTCIVLLPDLPPKGDISDWLEAGGTPDGLNALVAEGDHELPPARGGIPTPGREDDSSSERPSQTDRIVAFVRERNDLFHDENDFAYAHNRATGEVRLLEGRAFRHWLTAAFYEHSEKSVRDQGLREARMTLAGLAMQTYQPVHTRVAGTRGNYWLDLGEPGSSLAVHLQPGQWAIENATARFCRSDTAQAIPVPVRDGILDPLWDIANIPLEARLLVITWLVECLRPDTPFPVLELLGEHGSAKSTAQATLRCLIDPNTANLRGIPRSAEDLFISGGANHVISLENVSHLPPSLQDAMCVIATGGGFAKRRLYTDSDETVINLKRPVVLNGISAAITRQDLVSRTVTVEVPRIRSIQSRELLEAEFERNRPRIVGGLLDLAASALEYLPEMSLPPEKRPRLVEFAHLGMAVAMAMGQRPEAFMEQFHTARQDGLERTLDASPVAMAIRDHVTQSPGKQRKTAKQWLEVLSRYRPSGAEGWPRSAKGLGDAMRRAAPALRQLGIECQSAGKVGSHVQWSLGQVERQKSPEQSRASLEVVETEVPIQDLETCTTSSRTNAFAEDDHEEF